MKKTLKYILISIAGVMMCSGCVKLREDVEQEIIQRPRYDVEIPMQSGWDTIPQPDFATGK